MKTHEEEKHEFLGGDETVLRNGVEGFLEAGNGDAKFCARRMKK
jgi:hypothetical protein